MAKCDNCGHSIDSHTFGVMMVLRPNYVECKCKRYVDKDRKWQPDENFW